MAQQKAISAPAPLASSTCRNISTEAEFRYVVNYETAEELAENKSMLRPFD